MTIRIVTRSLMLGMLILGFVGVTAPSGAIAATPSYSVTGSVSTEGLLATADGNVSATGVSGKDYHVAINWNASGGGIWESLKDLVVTKGAIAPTSWQSAHRYSYPGTYKVRVLLYNAKITGRELPSQFYETTITVTALCADGVDNDGDGFVDMSDPGCSSPLDNSEHASTPIEP